MVATFTKKGSSKIWALALHGGAGPMKGENYDRSEAHMAELLREGGRMLEKGCAAVDVVCEMVKELEACGLHVAGKGSAPNRGGQSTRGGRNRGLDNGGTGKRTESDSSGEMEEVDSGDEKG